MLGVCQNGALASECFPKSHGRPNHKQFLQRVLFQQNLTAQSEFDGL
jgi:hypothetical protein